MRISSILLENIKKFNTKPAIFTFGGQPGLHTLSGGNGSGKTAIFKSVQVFQKIFFFDQLNAETDEELPELYLTIWQDLDGLMSAESSLIDIAFKHGQYGFRVELNLKRDHEGWNYEFKPGAAGDLGLLTEHWNITNPTGIVAFIDASKSFSDFGVGFDNIKLSPRRERQRLFVLDCVFEPEKTLQSIYRKAVIDHVQYRIDPKRTYEYFKKANQAIKRISGNIEVANISATKLDGQLVIVGRTSKGAPLFDVKDFSSGERALYLTLLFLFYLPNIGILIIDEPENHLHESLLCKFHDFLHDFLQYQTADNIDPKEVGDIHEDNESNADNNTELEQIFLTTHSRALLYKNLDQGVSFAMAGDAILPIEASRIERELRASGISTVYSRTLFVEGTTEASLMADFLGRERIKVTPANNCKEVIAFFEKISKIRSTIHGAAFCFAIDGDNRTAEDIAAIRGIDPTFFDQSFHILSCHEVENLFIEDALICDVANTIRSAFNRPALSVKEIRETMREEANTLRDLSRAKYIASGLRLELKNKILDPITDTKKIKSNNLDELIKNHISPTSQQAILAATRNLESNFDNLWSSDWKRYVDGKAYMGKLCARLSKLCSGANSNDIREAIVKRIKDDPEQYAFGNFYREIIEKFRIQGAL